MHDRASLGIGHQAAWPKEAPQAAHFAHYLRDGNCHIKVKPSPLDLLDQIVGPDVVSTGFAGQLFGLTLGEDQDTNLSACAMGQ